MSVGLEKREEDGYNSWTYATHIEGDGEANILSSFFCVRFSRKEQGQVLYLFSGVTYYLSRGEGGEEGEKGGGLGDHIVFIVAREYTDGTLN